MARAPGRRTRCGSRCAAGRGRPGGPGAGRRARWPTSTGPSTTPSPQTMAADAPCRGCGSRCASPARTSTGSWSSARRDRPHRPAAAAAPGGQPRAACSAPEVAALTGAVAARYAGTRVRRAAAGRPAAPRDRGEAGASAEPLPPVAPASPIAWSRRYPGGPRLPGGPRRRRPPRAVWTVAARGRLGRRCSPRRSRRRARLGPRRAGVPARPPRRRPARRGPDRAAGGGAARRASPPTPARRSATGAFLAVAPRRACASSIGTRAAAFAPVHDLGLVVIWDDGDDLHAEPRAPYPHAREVLLHARPADRARGRCSAAHARSVEAEYLVRTGWATSWPPRATVLRRRVARRSSPATATARPRPRPARPRRPAAERGARTAARRARATARCWCRRRAPATRPGWPATAAVRRPAARRCHGPLRVRGPGGAARSAPGAARRRRRGAAPSAAAAGCARRCWATRRTAEELGRAFPGVPVRTSSGDRVLGRGAVDAGDRGGHAGCRAGRRGRLRRRRAARHLAAAGPLRPAGRRGGTAALGQRRGAGAAGRRGGRVRGGR